MRRIIPTATTLLLCLVLAAPASAGGWATVEPDDPTAVRPVGIATELGFRVLQHGKTPASWVTATLVAINATSGARLQTPLRAEGADGRFVASVTFPELGQWNWSVRLDELGSDSAGSLTVAPPVEAFAAYAERVHQLELQLAAAMTALEQVVADGRTGDAAAAR
jgi:hypothetical protein